jgi:3D (Asp-Asp-Asp) domain-containing protein
VSFAPGAALPLRPYRSIAVDPNVIPLGSGVYIPAYRHDGHGGWFTAQDTGGAIIGRRIDVYRPPPATAGDPGAHLVGQQVYVVKPRRPGSPPARVAAG